MFDRPSKRVSEKILTGTEPVLVAMSTPNGIMLVISPNPTVVELQMIGPFVYPIKTSLTSIRPPGGRMLHTTITPTTSASVIPSHHRLRLLMRHDGPVPRVVNAEGSMHTYTAARPYR